MFAFLQTVNFFSTSLLHVKITRENNKSIGLKVEKIFSKYITYYSQKQNKERNQSFHTFTKIKKDKKKVEYHFSILILYILW